MECLVTVRGKDGESFKSRGNVNFGDGNLTVQYRLGGDDCTLTVSGRTARQIRRGEVNLDIPFIEGEHAFASLGEGENCGQFPVFTYGVKVIKGSLAVKVFLSYNLFGEDVELSLVAAYIGGNQ